MTRSTNSFFKSSSVETPGQMVHKVVYRPFEDTKDCYAFLQAKVYDDDVVSVKYHLQTKGYPKITNASKLPLQIAIEKHSKDMVTLLLDYTTVETYFTHPFEEQFEKSVEGYSPLFLALLFLALQNLPDTQEIADILLDRIKDIKDNKLKRRFFETKDTYGRTCLDCALQCSPQQIERFENNLLFIESECNQAHVLSNSRKPAWLLTFIEKKLSKLASQILNRDKEFFQIPENRDCINKAIVKAAQNDLPQVFGILYQLGANPYTLSKKDHLPALAIMQQHRRTYQLPSTQKRTTDSSRYDHKHPEIIRLEQKTPRSEGKRKNTLRKIDEEGNVSSPSYKNKGI